MGSNKSKSFFEKYFNYIFVLLIILVLFVYKYYTNSQLKDCFKIANGKIVAFFDSGPGLHGTKYIYFVEGKEYSGVIINQFYYKLKYKSFPVLYSCNDNSVNKILLKPKDFKELDLVYPDSLKWVLEYLEK